MLLNYINEITIYIMEDVAIHGSSGNEVYKVVPKDEEISKIKYLFYFILFYFILFYFTYFLILWYHLVNVISAAPMYCNILHDIYCNFIYII